MPNPNELKYRFQRSVLIRSLDCGLGDLQMLSDGCENWHAVRDTALVNLRVLTSQLQKAPSPQDLLGIVNPDYHIPSSAEAE